MSGQSSRERKERFMRDFGSCALRQAVVAAFDRLGADWLTDEQLDDIVRRQVDDWRLTQRLNLRNRALATARQQEE
jgi:hypothetical protein